MGASAIITGLSSSIAQTLVDLGVDVGMIRSVGDLQGGLEEAERLLELPHAEHAHATPRTDRVPARCRSPILKQGDYLIATIQSALSDAEVLALRDDLVERVGALRSRGIVIDVAALDVIDSFVARSLRDDRADGAAARRRDGDRRHPARRRGGDGAVPARTSSRCTRRLDLEEGSRCSTAARRTAMTDGRRGAAPDRRPTSDIVDARAEGRALATQLGFSRTDATLIATAISEIARNILVHAGSGEVAHAPASRRPALRPGRRRERLAGPASATSRRRCRRATGRRAASGSGFPARRRIMDEFEVQTGGPRHDRRDGEVAERDGLEPLNRAMSEADGPRVGRARAGRRRTRRCAATARS